MYLLPHIINDRNTIPYPIEQAIVTRYQFEYFPVIIWSLEIEWQCHLILLLLKVEGVVLSCAIHQQQLTRCILLPSVEITSSDHATMRLLPIYELQVHYTLSLLQSLYINPTLDYYLDFVDRH